MLTEITKIRRNDYEKQFENDSGIAGLNIKECL